MRTTIRPKKAKQSQKKESAAIYQEASATEIPGREEEFASNGVSNEERHHLIAKAAYHRAEQRSFAPGHELEDWLAAEAEIEMRLSHSFTGDVTKSA